VDAAVSRQQAKILPTKQVVIRMEEPPAANGRVKAI